MSHTMVKVRALRSAYPMLDIQVDGGLGPGASIQEAAEAGANVIVAGTSIFGSPSPSLVIQELRKEVDQRLLLDLKPLQ